MTAPITSDSREDILPPDPPPFTGVIGDTYRESTPVWNPDPRPRADAPNVLTILLDDLGFGHLSCYGGPIEAPNIARLARGGLRYNNFHTTSLCSPSRAALLTGRNHHSVGFSVITEMATGFPSKNAYLPRSAATIAEVLKQSGYSTYCVGKWHLTPSHQSTAAGPFDRWPLGQGFERFYGFMPGETDHWSPMLTTDNHRIPTPEREGYHLSEDLADNTIRMLRDQHQAGGGRPFFLHLAFGAPHCPFHVPDDYIRRYQGRFDHGWDRQREITFEQQKRLGIVPIDAMLPERNQGIKAWDELSADERRLFARLQETFCGFVDHTDTQIGRVLDELERQGRLENTLILFMSDNGASQEGLADGTINTERFRNLMPMTVGEMLADIDKIGGPSTDPHYPAGWGMAGNTPFKRWKRDSHRGGNTDPLIIHWPRQVLDGGAIRSQYHHITDIYPTLLEIIGLPVPVRVNGVGQMPLEGLSLAYSLSAPDAPSRKTIQHYEMLGTRAIWHEGWMAVTWHEPGTDWKNDAWELYHQDRDFTQANDLATLHPEKLKTMIELWWQQARQFNVLPLDDRFRLRGQEQPIPAPSAFEFKTQYTFWPGTAPVPSQTFPLRLNREHYIEAHIDVPASGAQGVIAALGSELGGWSLFMMNGRAHYVHNFLKIRCHKLSSRPLSAGFHRVVLHFVPTAQGKGLAQLFVDEVAQQEPQPIETAPYIYSAVQEGLQIGRQWGSATAYLDYHGAFPFTGMIDRVILRLPKRTKSTAGA